VFSAIYFCWIINQRKQKLVDSANASEKKQVQPTTFASTFMALSMDFLEAIVSATKTQQPCQTKETTQPKQALTKQHQQIRRKPNSRFCLYIRGL
jgi:hypothetical protein